MNNSLTNKAILISAKLLDRRDLARTLFGDRYDEQIARATTFVRDWMQSHGLKPIEALLDILRVMQEDRSQGASLAQLAIQAAVFEMYDKPAPTGQATGYRLANPQSEGEAQ